jgi:hypothetical protein
MTVIQRKYMQSGFLNIIYKQPFNTLLTGYSLMYESITEAILRHKQIVIAAIAVTALAGYVVPLNQFAVAQVGGEEDAFTTLEDFIAQDGTATATGDQDATITAPNTQTNAIVTGDARATQTNTATSTSTASSSAVGGSAEGGEGGDGCGNCDKKDSKKRSWSDGGSNDGDGGNAIGGDAFSAAQSGSSVSVNNNVNVADTSADGNTQTNNNDQDFDQDLDQDVSASVEQLATQINDNYFNVDLSGLLDD